MPDWVQNYRAVYPDSEYIAQRGRADTEETSKTEAVAQIARYFKTSINANLRTSIQSVVSGENVTETTSVVNDVDVMSQVDLFAVEYTDPYYNAAEKKWYCVAYIDRSKAWKQYKPEVDNAKSEFDSLYKAAEKENDPFSKCRAFNQAWKSGKKFLEKLEYARILDSNAEEAAYSGDRERTSGIPSIVYSEKEKCSVYLVIEGDYGNIISTSLTKTLSDNGLKISKSETGALYTAHAIVQSNAMGSDPISIYPSLDLKIHSKNGKTVYANQTKVEKKTIAYTLENAQKKAYPILAEESSSNINAELSEILGFK